MKKKTKKGIKASAHPAKRGDALKLFFLVRIVSKLCQGNVMRRLDSIGVGALEPALRVRAADERMLAVFGSDSIRHT